MQIPKSVVSSSLRLIIAMCLLAGITACKKDTGSEAIEADANGYVCLKCGAKLYTDRTVFIGPKCPKCNEDRLVQAVGYYCEKDQHLTIRASEGDRQGATCEKCQAPVINGMKAPHEKDLKTWGATKVKG
jgi:hypothetical protein